jgi:AraC family transcriptional regulator
MASVSLPGSASQLMRALARSPRLVNPPAVQLGHRNVVFSGSGTRHDSGQVAGWLSIKTMIAGSAVWETAERRFTVDEDSYLILNDHHSYRLRFESGAPAATFVLFFERGLAEDAFRCRTTPSARLLDQPSEAGAPAQFFERLETRASPLFGLLRRFRGRLAAGMSRAASDDWFLRLAAQMVREQRGAARAAGRLPAVRGSTRLELYRRVLRGRDFLLSQSSERVGLRDAARAACLSPFHFHRAFTQAFGQTPHQALTRCRLERAAALLATGERVTDVCLAVGFESLGSFSTLFQRHYGTSPRGYQQGVAQLARSKKREGFCSRNLISGAAGGRNLP